MVLILILWGILIWRKKILKTWIWFWSKIIFYFSKCFKIVFSTSPILCNFFNFTCRNSSEF